ncbi:LOW QUALITY PROTEIN: E3 ubiquitin/ISG15 ligase TRIM25-like [Leptodactylus fuscus]
MASLDLKDELTCSICLNIYTDPVTLRCGHNFCRECIDRVLDAQKKITAYSCPECREEFWERPVLQRNTTLHNVAECIRGPQPEKKTGVICTYCIHTSTPAVKSCLLCEASLCDDHMKVHSKSVEHVLWEPTTDIRSRKCSNHKMIHEYYCIDDGECICTMCKVGEEHERHEVISIYEASVRKKQELRNVEEKMSSMREEIEKRIESLPENMREVKGNACGITERATSLFRDLRRQLEDLEINVLSEISRQEMQASLSVYNMTQELGERKEKLSAKICQVVEIRSMTDPFTVLQGDKSSDFQDLQTLEEHKEVNLDLELIMKTGLSNIVAYEARGIFLKAPSSLHLDVNTASNYVTLSGDLKSASMSNIRQNFPMTPERFVEHQVLSTGGFSSGKHYWEVETSTTGIWTVGMAYSSIERTGDQSCIGYNNKSWGLKFSEGQYSVRHNKRVLSVPYSESCHKFRIYLDYEAGQMSFYDLTDPIRHLHTFTATFTEPLHAAFRVWGDSWVRLMN